MISWPVYRLSLRAILDGRKPYALLLLALLNDGRSMAGQGGGTG